MNNIVIKAKEEIRKLSENNEKNKVTTAEIRKTAAKLFKETEDKSADNVFALCEELLRERDGALSCIAYDMAYRVKAQYTFKTFDVFYWWLGEYVRDWNDCDDLCTHALGECVRMHKELFEKVKGLTLDSRFWVRRGAAVCLIPSIKKGETEGICPYTIADKLMNDDNELVLKGYGWMLKELSVTDPDGVRQYLEKHAADMPRTAFRYATEKFDTKTRKALLKLK